MNQRIIALSISLLSLIPTANSENLKDQPGWDIELNLNIGFASGKSQFNTDSDNEVTNDLNNRGKSTNSAVILPLYRVEYTLDDLNTQVFLGNSEDNIARGSLSDEIGFVHRFNDETVLTIAYAFDSEGLNETWQDPYLVGQKRRKTDESYKAIRVRADYIGGLPLNIEYAVAEQDIDKEHSGQALGLSTNQRKLLQRDLKAQQLKLEGFIPFSEDFVLIPGVFYTKADAEGDSNSFDGYGINLTVMRSFRHQYLAANIDYSKSDYQSSHPVFNKTREDKSISASVAYGYEEPFGWQSVTFTVLSGWGVTESNIKFFESDGLYSSAGLSYRF